MSQFPVELKLTLPKEHWPWTAPEEGCADESYSIEEIMMLLALCSQTNMLGHCCVSLKFLLELLGIKATKENLSIYEQVIERLIKRDVNTDYIQIRADEHTNLHDPLSPLCVHIVGNWYPSHTRFFQVSILEFERIRQCAIKYKKECWALLLIYLSLKACFIAVNCNGTKLNAGIIAKSTLSKRCELSSPTVDSYISALEKAQIISSLSGKPYGVSNIYCLYGDEAALSVMMRRQLEYLHIDPQSHSSRLLSKRFEGAY